MDDQAKQALELERREAARRAVLEFLANRQAVAHHANTVQRRLNEGHRNDFTSEEVNAALAFLHGAALVKYEHDALGGTKYWQATCTGVLANERSEPTE